MTLNRLAVLNNGGSKTKGPTIFRIPTRGDPHHFSKAQNGAESTVLGFEKKPKKLDNRLEIPY